MIFHKIVDLEEHDFSFVITRTFVALILRILIKFKRNICMNIFVCNRSVSVWNDLPNEVVHVTVF